MSQGNNQKYLNTALAAFAFTFTLLFFIPLNLYLNNIMEYYLPLWNIVAVTFVIAVVATIPVAFLCGISNNKIHKKFTVILGVLAVLIWIEANFVAWKLGAINGKDVDWSKVPFYYYFDILGWFFIMGGCLWKLDGVYRMIRQISLILIVTQFVGLGMGIYSAPSRMPSQQYKLDYTKQFEFSSEKNVILLVLDGAQTDFFQELLNEDTDYKNQFADFTYFRDTLGGYPYTSLSVPNFLTGHYYDNSVYIQDFLQTAYKNSLLSVLKQDNFDIRVYPTIKYTLLYDQTLLDNIKKRDMFDDESINQVKDIYKIALLKAEPYSVRRFINSMLLSDIAYAVTSTPIKENPDIVFVKRFEKTKKITDRNNVFRYYHLFGLHYPLALDRNLNHVDGEYNRTNYKEQYIGVLKLVNKLLQELKDNGIYDNSIIIIMGDHGSQLSSFNQKAAGIMDETTWQGRFPDVMGLSHPLLLVKKMNAHEPFKISDAPVSLSDIPITVAEELGIQNSLPGKSMFKISEELKRERIFYRGELNPDFTATPLLEYKINGNSWLVESYKEGNAKMPQQEYKSSEVNGNND